MREQLVTSKEALERERAGMRSETSSAVNVCVIAITITQTSLWIPSSPHAYNKITESM